MLRAVVHRLAGFADGDAKPDDEAQPVWAAAAAYLHGRIQTRGDERPGRPPDMSESAGAALRRRTAR